jgi:peptidoglycan/LPS O-acetylase OafA/YrhL
VTGDAPQPVAPGRGGDADRPPDVVVTPPPHHPRFPLADGVRGVASVAVVVVHAWFFSGGFGGYGNSLENRAVVRLDVVIAFFFILSAFLLYRPMIAHRAGGPPGLTLSRYARSRFLRVYPPYWVALTVLAIVPGLVGVFSSDWWHFYSLFGNWDQYLYGNPDCAGQHFRCGLPQTWTLTTELSFYIVLPAYAALTARLARGRSVRGWVRVELALIAGLAAVSLFLNVPPADLRDQAWFRFSFLGHFYWLGLGLALAVVSVGLRGRMWRWLDRLAAAPALAWGLGLAVYAVMVMVFPAVPFIVAGDTTAEFLGLHLAQGLLATLFLIPVLLGDPNSALPRRLLANPVVAWLGLVSYGIYLWHVTIAYDLGTGGADAGFWTVLLGSALIAVPLAALTHYAIERPLLRRRNRPLRELLRRRSP